MSKGYMISTMRNGRVRGIQFTVVSMVAFQAGEKFFLFLLGLHIFALERMLLHRVGRLYLTNK